VSAESGLGTFRDPGGIWAKFDPMKLATPAAFARDPARVHEFYNLCRRNLLGAVPNAAHLALARLEAALALGGGGLFLCTQNIDDLHEQAGHRAVHHMHGELLKARCTRCGAATPLRRRLCACNCSLKHVPMEACLPGLWRTRLMAQERLAKAGGVA
jgi:NAD-dependent deacetylase